MIKEHLAHQVTETIIIMHWQTPVAGGRSTHSLLELKVVSSHEMFGL